MAKFKVGDRVRVKKDLVPGDYHRPNICDGYLYFSPNMSEYKGCIYIIESVDSKGDYTLEGVKYWLFCDAMLEPYDKFTKADLKDGMVVEYANGKRRLFCNGIFMGKWQYSELREFDDNLHCVVPGREKECTINKVYTSIGRCFNSVCENGNLTLIWERPEEEYKEMTVEEIEKALGCKIKVVGDKNT